MSKSLPTQWAAVVAMEWEVEVMVWEVASTWEEVVMEWEHLPGESEVPALEDWRLGLETGSAWSARTSTSHGATSATSVRSRKETQCPSNKDLQGVGVVALEVLRRLGLEIGIAQSRFSTFQSFFQFGFQVRQLELLQQN